MRSGPPIHLDGLSATISLKPSGCHDQSDAMRVSRQLDRTRIAVRRPTPQSVFADTLRVAENYRPMHKGETSGPILLQVSPCPVCSSYFSFRLIFPAPENANYAFSGKGVTYS
jgi:hypothetical protein